MESGSALFSPYGQLARKDLPGVNQRPAKARLRNLPVAIRTAVPRKLKITRHMPRGTGRERGVSSSVCICPGQVRRALPRGAGGFITRQGLPSFPPLSRHRAGKDSDGEIRGTEGKDDTCSAQPSGRAAGEAEPIAAFHA